VRRGCQLLYWHTIHVLQITYENQRSLIERILLFLVKVEYLKLTLSYGHSFILSGHVHAGQFYIIAPLIWYLAPMYWGSYPSTGLSRHHLLNLVYYRT
jgi:hypothetical protein